MSLMVFIWDVIDTYPHEHISTDHDYVPPRGAGRGKRAPPFYTTQHHGWDTGLESAPHATLSVAFGVVFTPLRLILYHFLATHWGCEIYNRLGRERLP